MQKKNPNGLESQGATTGSIRTARLRQVIQAAHEKALLESNGMPTPAVSNLEQEHDRDAKLHTESLEHERIRLVQADKEADAMARDLSRRIDLIHLRIDSQLSSVRIYGVDVAADADAVARDAKWILRGRIQSAWRRGGPRACVAVLDDFEAKLGKNVLQPMQLQQSKYQIGISGAQQAAQQQADLSTSAAMSPEKALTTLLNAGLALRLNRDGKLEVAGRAFTYFERAIVDRHLEDLKHLSRAANDSR